MWIEASGGGGGTQITPSDATPVALVNGETYEMGGNGYAIESYDDVTPTAAGAAFLAGMNKMSAGGFAFSQMPSVSGYSLAAKDTAAAAATKTLSNLSGKTLLLFVFQYSAQSNIPYNRYENIMVSGGTATEIATLLDAGANVSGVFYELNVTSDTCTITHTNNMRVIAFEAEL